MEANKTKRIQYIISNNFLIPLYHPITTSYYQLQENCVTGTTYRWEISVAVVIHDVFRHIKYSTPNIYSQFGHSGMQRLIYYFRDIKAGAHPATDQTIGRAKGGGMMHNITLTALHYTYLHGVVFYLP